MGVLFETLIFVELFRALEAGNLLGFAVCFTEVP